MIPLRSTQSRYPWLSRSKISPANQFDRQEHAGESSASDTHSGRYGSNVESFASGDTISEAPISQYRSGDISMPRVFLALAAFALMCGYSSAQDDQPLGDLARQVRAQKQQKAAQGKDAANSAKSISNTDEISGNDAAQGKTQHTSTEETPDHAGVKSASSAHSDATKSESKDSKPSDFTPSPADREAQAENWKSQIQEQKIAIAELQAQIDQVGSSIQYAGANCVSNCEKWNEHQQHKQEQVDTMKSQLEELQHHLEEMQESARKQGYGSSVYEP